MPAEPAATGEASSESPAAGTSEPAPAALTVAAAAATTAAAALVALADWRLRDDFGFVFDFTLPPRPGAPR